jgi:rod shape-determining protein MreD
MMSNTSVLRLWTMRAAFVGLALLILLVNLLPLQTVPRGWAGPDLIFCLALAWSVRRPDYVPIVLLGAVFLMADLVLSRPPGLAAALMLLACFNLRTRMRRLRDSGFLAEWARAILLIIAVAVIYRLVLALVLVPIPPLGLSIFQTVATALSYPLVVGFSALLFGLRASVPGDIDAMRQRT